MGEGSKDVNVTRDAESSPETASIRAEIEQKRTDISDTLNEIQERLTPRNLVSQATGSVRDATNSRIRQVRGAATGAATQVASTTRRAAVRTAEQAREHPWSAAAAVAGVGAAAWWLATRSPGRDGWDYDDYSEESLYADENFALSEGNAGLGSALKTGTLPVVLSGVAVGYWLWRRNRGGSAIQADGELDYDASWNEGTYGSAGADAGSYRSFEGDRRWRDEGSLASEGRFRQAWSDAATRAREAAAAAGERTREVANRAQQRLTDGGRQMASQVERWVDENPLAAGAAALLAGLAIGLAVPESNRERRLMAGPRRKLITRAQQAGRDAVGRARQTVVDAASGRRPYQR
jgi:ElaB/YqjD/DUF883 family membrane-anchored ribosome-binding protein